MNSELADQIKAYDSKLNLDEAMTPPSVWYTSDEFAAIENQSVFVNNWIMAARADQLEQSGQYHAL